MPNPRPLRIHIGPLPYVELVSALSALAEGLPLPFRDQLQLHPKAQAFLEELRHFRVKGMEFLEFALLLEDLARPRTLLQTLQAIHRLPDPVFAHTLFGEELGQDVVEVLLGHFGKLDFLLSRDLKHAPISHRELTAVFGNLKAFRQGFRSAARALAPFITLERERYAPAMARIQGLLRDRTPLEAAQALMGKTFKRVSDYTDFWFVPARHYRRKTMRTFSERILLVTCPLEDAPQGFGHADLVRFLKALGDDNRLAIARRLAERPHTGKELAQELSLTTATITHHLDQLRVSGLLHEERDGNAKYVSLNRTAYQAFLRALAFPD